MMYHGSKSTGWRFCLKYQMQFAAQCPYWIGHAKVQNRILEDQLFEKWQQRPQASWRLYWRQHPHEQILANTR